MNRSSIDSFKPARITQGPLPNFLRVWLFVLWPTFVWLGLTSWVINKQLGPIVDHKYLISNHLGIVWVLSGLALGYAALTQRHNRTVGITVLLATLFTYLLTLHFPVWQSYQTTLVAMVYALLFIGAGITLLKPKRIYKEFFKPIPIGILIAIVGSGVSVWGTMLLLERSVWQIRETSKLSAAAVANDLQSTVSEATRLLERQAARWKLFDGLPPPEYVDVEFSTHIRDIPAFKRMIYTNQNLQLTDRSGPITLVPEWLKDVVYDPARRPWFDDIRDSGKLHLTPIILPNHQGTVLLFVMPLFDRENRHMGFTLVQTDLDELIADGFFKPVPPCCFEITLGDRTLFLKVSANNASLIDERHLDISLNRDLTVHLRYWQQDPAPAPGLGGLPEASLLIGLLFTFFTNGSYRLAYLARRRSAQLHQISRHDPLTGLPNRRMLEDALRAATNNSDAVATQIALVFIDINGIRLINDSMGHMVGDQLLSEAAHRLKASTPSQAKIARLDGGEFIVLIQGEAVKQIENWTTALLSSIEKPYFVNHSILRLTAVAGITSHPNSLALSDPTTLLREADLAMLKAKREGERLQQFTPDLSARVAKQLSLRNDLQSALENNELALNYQPVLCGQTGDVVATEALMRWHHPTQGSVSPALFIPMAEETGLISSLTDWALLTACKDNQLLGQKGLPQYPIAVNISPLYFSRKDFVAKVESVLEMTKLAPELLALEITESVLLNDLPSAISKLTKLKERGIQTALDDFGTGYSSLSYLKKLPITKVKIDRSFIIDVATNSVDEAIVQGVTQLAHHLNLIVVVEGVESADQFTVLSQIGCDQFQGYLFSKPVPFNQLEEAFKQAPRIATQINNPHRSESPLI